MPHCRSVSMLLNKLDNIADQAGKHIESNKEKDDPETEPEQEKHYQGDKSSQFEPADVLEDK